MTTGFLLDQMLGADVAAALNKVGFQALRVSELGMARSTDREILQRAIEEDRVLITLDDHFGDWAVLPLQRHPGVIRVKANPATTQNVLTVLVPFLEKTTATALRDTLVIISTRSVRRVHTGLFGGPV